MLKIRLMGTKNDITWFKKIMQRHPKVEVLEMSDLLVSTPDQKKIDFLYPQISLPIIPAIAVY